MHPAATVSGDRVDPGVQACDRGNGQAGSASRSLAIPAVAIFAGWRFRLNGRRKPDLCAPGRGLADYAPAAMSRYCFRMRLAEANRRLTRSCIQLPV